MTPDQWRALARIRVLKILRTHRVCSGRTLESKISDAGPYDQRAEPHHITTALKQLRRSGGKISLRRLPTGNWYHLPTSTEKEVDARLAELEPLQRAVSDPQRRLRIGQTLEIAVYRALVAASDVLDTFGAFRDLDDHGDDRLYKKQEPYVFRGRQCSKGPLDFIVVGASRIAGGIEVKNGREWLYADREEVAETLLKCCELDLVPVLVARRVHFTTRTLFRNYGGIVWQTLTQRFPVADATVAQQARDKHLLGYHDIRIGNDADPHLLRFVRRLPELLPTARARFEEGREKLEAFARGELSLDDLGISW